MARLWLRRRDTRGSIAGSAGAVGMDEAELRIKCKAIFEKFDVDGSGAVSTEEMAAMCKAISMDRTPEQITQMVSEADPDGYAAEHKNDDIALYSLYLPL